MCVVSNIPEHHSIIHDGENGFLVDIENIDLLNKKLNEILKMNNRQLKIIGLKAN